MTSLTAAQQYVGSWGHSCHASTLSGETFLRGCLIPRCSPRSPTHRGGASIGWRPTSPRSFLRSAGCASPARIIATDYVHRAQSLQLTTSLTLEHRNLLARAAAHFSTAAHDSIGGNS
jgi:hypothetical protein